MKKYICEEVKSTGLRTEERLNELSKDGWNLVCSYSNGMWLILEKEVTIK